MDDSWTKTKKDTVWEILEQIRDEISSILSVRPCYNSELGRIIGIKRIPKNRGGGNYFQWSISRNKDLICLQPGAAVDEKAELKPGNIMVKEEKYDERAVSHPEEILKTCHINIQRHIGELCDIFREYIKRHPDKAYGGFIYKSLGLDNDPETSSTEIGDYIMKTMMDQNLVEFTGEQGPRGSKLLRVKSWLPYTAMESITDTKQSRKGQSLGEAAAATALRDYLENCPIIHQWKSKECRDKKELPFDFYDPTNNVAFEIDGAQHFRPVEYFGGRFDYVRSHDKIISRFCIDRDITLVRIDSTTRDVKRSVTKAYEDIEKERYGMLCYGDNYDLAYIDDVLDKGRAKLDNGSFSHVDLGRK
jgi:hypothetical protein